LTTLSLDYRCDNRYRPHFLKHAVVEEIALQARKQLVGLEEDALPLTVLREITGLDINGLTFELWVDLEHPIRDEKGKAVFGCCEFDPGAGSDAAILSVSPVGREMTDELVLSTFAHELGHAVFDAPGWISGTRIGADLFGELDAAVSKKYRTTTANAEHLSRSLPCAEDPYRGSEAHAFRSEPEKIARFQEFRANAFMGALLVPRHRLILATLEMAAYAEVELEHHSTLFGDQAPVMLRPDEAHPYRFEGLLIALAIRFGVNPRFIRVRLAHYGLLPSQFASI
jgi:hypothetical protein